MIIYNTTFSVEPSAVREFVEWIKATYLPTALNDGRLSNPQLMRIMAQQEGGVTYALQLQADSLGTLQRWYQSTGKKLTMQMTSQFGQRIVGFSTMMEKIEIDR